MPRLFYTAYLIFPALALYWSVITRDNFSYPWLLGSVLIATALAIFYVRRYAEEFARKPHAVILFALCSAVLTFAPPLLSDDIERYVWEGHVQNLGYNPYSTPPNDPAFAGEKLRLKVGHPHMGAVYPPLAQMIFRVLAYIHPSVIFFKVFLSLAALGLIYFLYRRREEFSQSYLPATLFPFVAIETLWNGHYDVLAIFSLVLAVFYQKRNLFLSGVALGASAMLKLLPAIFFLHFVFRIFRDNRETASGSALEFTFENGPKSKRGAPRFQESQKVSCDFPGDKKNATGSPDQSKRSAPGDSQTKQKSLKQISLFTAGFILPWLLYLPYLSAGKSLFASLSTYSSEWVFGGFFYTALGQIPGLGPEILRPALGLTFAALWAVALFKIKDLKEAIFLTWLALLLLSPVVHPWYVLWLIPFAGARGNRYFYTTVAFLVASFAMYEVLGDWFLYERWAEKPLVVIGVYLCAMGVAVAEKWKRALPANVLPM